MKIKFVILPITAVLAAHVERSIEPVKPSMADLRPLVPEKASPEGLEEFRRTVASKDFAEAEFKPSVSMKNMYQVLPEFRIVQLEKLSGSKEYPAVFVSENLENYVLKYSVSCRTRDIIKETLMQQIAANNGLAVPVMYLSAPMSYSNQDMEVIFGWKCEGTDSGQVRYQVVAREGSTLRERKQSSRIFNIASSIYNAQKVLEMLKSLHELGIVQGHVIMDSIGYLHGDFSPLKFFNFSDSTFVDNDKLGIFRSRDVQSAVQMVMTLSDNDSLGQDIEHMLRSIPHVPLENILKALDCLQTASIGTRPNISIPYELIISYLKTAWSLLGTKPGKDLTC